MNFVDYFIEDIELNEEKGTHPNYNYTVQHKNAQLLVEEIKRLRKEVGPDFEWGDRVVFESKHGPERHGIFLNMLEGSRTAAWVIFEGNSKFNPVQVNELRKEEE